MGSSLSLIVASILDKLRAKQWRETIKKALFLEEMINESLSFLSISLLDTKDNPLQPYLECSRC